MLWSILICQIPERWHSSHGLLYSLLETQAVARRPEVELLALMDNRRRTVGEKRNALLSIAQGEYVSFIDDDDAVSPDYVQKIVAAIAHARKADPPIDVICFPQRATIGNTGGVHECRYSLSYFKDRPADQRRQLAGTGNPMVAAWSGPPAHTMVWRRALVKDIPFPDETFGEDVAWVDQACERAKTEMQIEAPHPLYIYRFSDEGTMTR